VDCRVSGVHVDMKTRLKWRKTKEPNILDFDAHLRVNRRMYYDLYIGLEQVSPTRVQVCRIIWSGKDDVPLFEQTKTHAGTVAEFASHLRGMEQNLLSQLSKHLEAALTKVTNLMFETEEKT
jgi:hypothetical protein